jgi:hypothetical protein
VIDLLRRYAPEYLARHGQQAPPQVRGTLAKLQLCRTAALGGHLLECGDGGHRVPVYNSCRDRHCPQCRGAQRADWFARTAELILPGVVYFQVVFTVPDELAALLLGNRRTTYGQLFRSAWSALAAELRNAGFAPAAWLVLHTWNQRLEHHPHVHALVPGGGPSSDGTRWVASRHRRHHGRVRPYLTDVQVLSARFRDHFLAGLRRLHARGELRLEGEWSCRRDAAAFAAWLQPFADRAWVVFVEPPPQENSRPEYVLKYLARYLTGGPLSDRRLLSHHNGEVVFWARDGHKGTGNRAVPYTLPGREFVRRWSLHVLPKGLVRSRGYGGYAGRHRQRYLRQCRALLATVAKATVQGSSLVAIPTDERPRESLAPARESAALGPRCPHCQTPLACREWRPRPSWRTLLTSPRPEPPDD